VFIQRQRGVWLRDGSAQVIDKWVHPDGFGRWLQQLAGISKRSEEKARLDVEALHRSGADSLETMADLNRAMWKIIEDSLKTERAGKNIPEKELLETYRRIALLGRRDSPRP
jgi:hypothetical protein